MTRLCSIITLILICSTTTCFGNQMTWTQVTPTDSNGCAGYTPSNYDQPNLSSSANVYTLPQQSSRDDSPKDNGHHYGNDESDNHGYKHQYGNNTGHGQYDSTEKGGYDWNTQQQDW